LSLNFNDEAPPARISKVICVHFLGWAEKKVRGPTIDGLPSIDFAVCALHNEAEARVPMGMVRHYCLGSVGGFSHVKSCYELAIYDLTIMFNSERSIWFHDIQTFHHLFAVKLRTNYFR